MKIRFKLLYILFAIFESTMHILPMNNYSNYFDISSNTCQFYDFNEFNNQFCHESNLFIMNFNIRSFNSNYDDFSVFLNDLKFMPDIIILTETWFLDDTCVDIEGFHGYHSSRSSEFSGHGGGVSVYVKKSLTVKHFIEFSESLPEMELMHVKLIYENSKYINILAIYRPPNSMLVNKFIDKLDSILDKISVRSKIVIAGDLNIDGLVETNNTMNLFDALKTYCLSPHIILPTRPNSIERHDTQIDHIWSNFDTDCGSGVFGDVLITDHSPNFTILPFNIVQSVVKKTFRDHSESCIDNMVTMIENLWLSFPVLTENLEFDFKFNLFFDEILSIYKTSCPLRTKSFSGSKLVKPWIDDFLKIKIKRKHYLFKRYKKGAIPFSVYNTHKLQTERIVKNAERNYYARKYEACRGDSGQTWKITSRLLNKKKSSTPTFEIMHNNVLETDETKICNIFNSYFSQVGTNLASGITENNTDPLFYLGERNPHSFYFGDTSIDEVTRLIMSFKNKNTSVNNLPVFILKRVCHVVAPFIVKLFNESISLGIFPDKLKIGRIIPLHKGGPRNCAGNFRPITTLSVFSKVFEKLVYKRLSSFIKKFNILNNNQFGFQKGKSTSDAILEFLDHAYDSLNDSSFLLTIYLDFSKAFDTISFDILLEKLGHYGFRNEIKCWVQSYLQGRHQFVSIGNSNSGMLETKMGVPQGSTLGPLLFLIYISDMRNALSNMKIIHFADDSTLYLDYNKNINCSYLVNYDLETLNSWLSINKLYLNINKTKYMIINNRGRPPDLELRIGETLLERTEVHKFLGVHLDHQLTFSVHANKLCSKMSRNIGIIRKLSSVVPQSVLRNLHFSFVYSHCIYAINSFGSATVSVIGRISKLLDKSIRNIYDRNRQINEICKSENLLNFSLAFQYFASIKMFQILCMNSHSYFANKIESCQVHHNYRTRNSALDLCTLPMVRFSKCQRSFVYIGIKFWNCLPVYIRNIEQLNKFKKALKNHLLSSLDG